MWSDVTYTDIIYKVLHHRRQIISSNTAGREQFAYRFLVHIRHHTYVYHVYSLHISYIRFRHVIR